MSRVHVLWVLSTGIEAKGLDCFLVGQELDVACLPYESRSSPALFVFGHARLPLARSRN